MSIKITNEEAKKLIESMILNEVPISMSCKNEPATMQQEG